MIFKVKKNKFSEKNIYPFFGLILTILLISFVIFRQYIFGNYYFLSKGLWSDLVRVNLPTYYQLFDSIKEGGIFWSWKMGIGTDAFSHADVFFDPFTYILFIKGRSGIPYMMVWLFIVKLVFQGISMNFYLKYLKINPWASAIASVLYAFSGYSLIMGNNFALSTILVYTPLVFCGLEKWIKEKKYLLLLLGLFLTCIYSYYFFYILGIMSAVYLIIRCKWCGAKIFKNLLFLLLMGILAILLSSFALLPQLQLVLNSPRVSGSSDINTGISLWIPQIKVLITGIMRLIENNVLGNPINSHYMGTTYFNSMDYFQMSCYVSSYFFVFYWHYIKTEKENRKKIIFISTLIAIAILVPVVSFVFNAFSTINARWLFVLSILGSLIIAISIDSIIAHKKVDLLALLEGVLGSIVIILVGIFFFCINSSSYTKTYQEYLNTAQNSIYILIFLSLGIILVSLIYNVHFVPEKIKNPFIIISFIVLISVDITLNYYHIFEVDNNTYTKNDAIYDDASAQIIESIMEEDTSFYRINKTFDSVYDSNLIPSENDAMAQGYYGLKSYNSINNNEYINFLQQVGIYVCIPLNIDYYKNSGIEPEDIVGQTLNYIDGVENDPCLLDYLGVKYFLTKEGEDIPAETYDFLYQTNGINVYHNKAAFPLAFVNNKIMTLSDFKGLTDKEKREVLLSYTIIDDNTIVSDHYEKSPSSTEILEMAEQKNAAFELLYFSEDNIAFNITVDELKAYLSFSIPYDENWHIYIDNQEVKTEKINISLLGAEITEGTHHVVLKYVPEMFYLGLIFSGITFICILIVYVIIRFYQKNKIIVN